MSQVYPTVYHPAVFVTFEGPEGAGKTTAIGFIADRLRQQGQEVLVTREPGSGDFGARVREILLHGEGMPAASELFLFLADRANHVEKIIRPALAEGKLVLCDRYADSTYVYQALVRGLDPTFVKRANEIATGGLQPDATFLLDLLPEIGLARLKNKDRIDLEPLEFHEKVRNGFRQLASEDPARWHIVDATQPPEAIVEAFFAWQTPTPPSEQAAFSFD